MGNIVGVEEPATPPRLSIADDLDLGDEDVMNVLRMYTDASERNNFCGVGVACEYEGRWYGGCLSLGASRSTNCLNSTTAEWLAIAEGCRIMHHQILETEEIDVLRIYTDCRHVPRGMHTVRGTLQCNHVLEAETLDQVMQLEELGVKVEIKWIRAHGADDGNFLADGLAYHAAGRAREGAPTDTGYPWFDLPIPQTPAELTNDFEAFPRHNKTGPEREEMKLAVWRRRGATRTARRRRSNR